MSNSTIVSIVPFPIAEFKPGIYPGFFEIPGAKKGIPELLVIGDSRFYVEIDENRTVTVPAPSEQMAKSIVDDYLISNLAYSVEEDAMPGLFWLPGKWELSELIVKHNNLIELSQARQKRWYNKLVQIADDDWEKTRQHKFISDVQRFAAKDLKLERPWIINVKEDERGVMVMKCVACMSVINAEAIICPNCRCIINREKYEKLQFAGASAELK